MAGIVNVSHSRRRFLVGGAVFVLGFALPAVRPRAAAASGPGVLNAFLGIGADGIVTVQCPFIEMGQGTYTAIPMVILEELDAPMQAVRVVQAPPAPEYRIMFGGTARFTGGSLSVRSSFDILRRAGAAARAMLVAAAAEDWGVPAVECRTEPGVVVHVPRGRRRGYGELAALAARLAPPADVALKPRADFRLIGRPIPRTDTPAKVTGTAEFGVDVRLPGMLHAAVRQCPVFGGDIVSFDAAAVRDLPGVVAVERIPRGVAVLAETHWQAQRALDALPIQIEAGDDAAWSSAGYLEQLRRRLDDPGAAAERQGDAPAAIAAAKRVVRADYDVPLLAHATLEPMNCTALVADGRCTVWAPNQGVDYVVEVAARVSGLPKEAIEVHTPYLGGGFGRRFLVDFAEQAVTLAARHPGRPVQVLWSREEDTQHDFYRPLIACRMRAALENGRVTALHATVAGDGPTRQHNPQFMDDPDIDDSVVEGLRHQPYAIPARQVDYVYEHSPVPLGYWRSVGNSMNAFFKESFIDELAHAARRDPIDFRRELLAEAPRHRAVLERVAAMAGWRREAWTGDDGMRRAMGVALHESFGSIVGQIAEVSLDGGGPRVHKVWCAVDCGSVVNPAIVIMQMESGIAFGLSAALGERVTVENGRVQQANFDGYPILTAAQMPEVEVDVIESGAQMGGIGEPGTPPIAPAVCNGLFTLTGTRVRTLPLAGQALGCKACA